MSSFPEGTPCREPCTPADTAIVTAQLGRPPRGVNAVAYRCPCGLPAVVETLPILSDGTPFPTLYYMTCPRASAECGRWEATGIMGELTARLGHDQGWAAQYESAHQDYLTRRTALGDIPEIRGISAGGMPDRVKCLHVHLAHALAVGRGVNPVGDFILDRIVPWWDECWRMRCVDTE